MKDLTRRTPIDPFATMVSLTAAALTGSTARQTQEPARNARSPRSIFERIEHWLWSARQRELERALTTATDVADVESRLRARERQLLQRYY